VILLGAGPGDPDLITVRGAAALRVADAVVYDSLAAPELLELAPADALRIDVGKRGHELPTRSQEEVNALLVRLAREGRTVVRLKGGDPFVFGRGGEEASACVAAGIPFEVVPGVTSALAVPAHAGIPVTDRRHAASFAVVTGHRDATRPWTSVRWDRLATATDTLVIVMGMRNLEKLVQTLLDHGRDPETPAAAIMDGATAHQRTVEAPLAELPRRVREAGLGSPAVVVVGDVVRLRRELAWFERSPLFGWRVLVTRSAEQAGDLARALRAAGAEPIVMPLVRAVPVSDPGPLDVALDRLEEYDGIVFTSANGVRFFADRARSRGVALERVRARVICVGPATAAAARAAGLPDPHVPDRRFDAEGLLEAVVRLVPPAGRRFLHPRAAAGRDLLPEGLRCAGARVDLVPVYRTVPAEVDRDALIGALVRGELDALTFTSPSSVRHFLAQLDREAREALRAIPVAAIGSVTAGALREAGLEPDAVAERSGVDELVAALAEHAARRRRRTP
jgi:uroporphyrinogen III methyltransferase/synthase